jgi:hypothetical protein
VIYRPWVIAYLAALFFMAIVLLTMSMSAGDSSSYPTHTPAILP